MNKRERGRCQRDEEGIQLKDCFDGTVSIRLENKLHFMVLVFGTCYFWTIMEVYGTARQYSAAQ